MPGSTISVAKAQTTARNAVFFKGIALLARIFGRNGIPWLFGD